MKKEVIYNKDINFTEDKVDIQRVEEVVADTSVKKEEDIIEEHGLQNNDLSDIRNEDWRIILDNETPITRLERNEGDLEGVQQHLIEAQYFDVTIKDNSSSFIEKRNRVQDSNEDILDFNMQVLHEHDDIQMNDNRTLDGSEEWNDFFNAKAAYISAKLHKKHEVKKMIKDLLGINMLALDEDCDTNPRNSGYSSFAENIENDLKEESVEDKEQVSDKRVGNISLPMGLSH
ncbi:MAG: hypothetical protein ACRY3E_03295 [Candidatus Lariskella arthropodorum]